MGRRPSRFAPGEELPGQGIRMSTKACCKLFLLLCVSAEVAGCGNRAVTTALPAGQPPATYAMQQRQIAVDREVAEINSSNLAPQDKQRLIDKVQASGGQQ